MARPLVQRHEPDVVASNPGSEIGDVGQRHHGVPVGLAGKPVDQIGHAIFESADVETVNHMDDQRTWIAAFTRGRTRAHGATARRSAALIDPCMSVLNSRSMVPASTVLLSAGT